MYGLQLESSATYPSSYIPNHGTSGGVTRAADSCSVTGASDVIGQTEGTLYAEVVIERAALSTDRLLILNDGTGNERIGISLGATGLIYAFVVYGNVTQSEIISSGNTAGVYKVAFAYKANDFAFYINGTQIGTDTNGTIPSCSRVDIGNQLGVSQLGGGIKQATLFNERLSNAELAALTA